MLPHEGQFTASEKHLPSELLKVNPCLELVFWVILGHSSAELGAWGVLLAGTLLFETQGTELQGCILVGWLGALTHPVPSRDRCPQVPGTQQRGKHQHFPLALSKRTEQKELHSAAVSAAPLLRTEGSVYPGP